MRKVGSREFKNRLGQYLAVVKQGHSLIVTDRGRPIAKLCPPDPVEQTTDSLETRLKELEEQGFIHLPKRAMKNFKAIPSRGKLASEMIIEDRR